MIRQIIFTTSCNKRSDASQHALGHLFIYPNVRYCLLKALFYNRISNTSTQKKKDSRPSLIGIVPDGFRSIGSNSSPNRNFLHK
ncbi:hypothetical protein PAEVO_64900 [Paenibacillus sp. GM2FR]|nr:hypothetical protein PAEVO_64900 [Paenibacillus sp. GM2FR]